MGKLFESLVNADDRFEVPAERHLGLVTFRLKVGCRHVANLSLWHLYL